MHNTMQVRHGPHGVLDLKIALCNLALKSSRTISARTRCEMRPNLSGLVVYNTVVDEARWEIDPRSDRASDLPYRASSRGAEDCTETSSILSTQASAERVFANVT